MVAAKGGQRVGYCRVSSADQNAVRQLDGIQIDERFEDKASGKDTNRPALQAALKHVRRGDVLVVHSMDRLARNLSDLLALVKELTSKGVAVEFFKEKLAFTGDDSPTSKLMLAVMGGAAEFERDMIRARQREGIDAAKARGKHLGHVAALTPVQVQELRQRVAANETRQRSPRYSASAVRACTTTWWSNTPPIALSACPGFAGDTEGQTIRSCACSSERRQSMPAPRRQPTDGMQDEHVRSRRGSTDCTALRLSRS